MNQDGTNKRYLVRDRSDDRQPRWSPDGKVIAFTSSGKLYVVDPGGGKPRQLFERPAEEPQWSPDGRRIAFIGRHSDEPYTIHVVDRDGQYLNGLENPERATLCDLRWSPDGDQIAYTSVLGSDCFVPFKDNPHRIMIADAQGSSRARKVAGNLAQVRDLAWVDREILTYSSRQDTRSGYALYNIDLRSGLSTKIKTEEEILHYAWTPDGTALAYTNLSHAVFVKNRLSGDAALVWKENGVTISHIEWSPDSQRLLISVSEQVPPEYIMGLPGYAETIWVISRDGKSAQRLTPLKPGEPDP